MCTPFSLEIVGAVAVKGLMTDWRGKRSLPCKAIYTCIHVHNAGVGEKQLTFLHMHTAKKALIFFN